MILNKLYFLFLILFVSCTNEKQKTNTNNGADSISTKNTYVKPDQSEMDISWCPADYPIQKMQEDSNNKLIARVVYSRPHKKGRAIFGESADNLCMYGKPWRLGANEATEITFFDDVLIENKIVVKGTYIIYCIPQKENWIIKLNTNLYTWGLHIDESKDVFSTTVKTENQEPAIENFTLVFDENTTGANLIMVWDNVKVALPIAYAK